MITFEENKTIQKENETYTNNIQKGKITIQLPNTEITKPYCILSIHENTSIIKQANNIQTINNNDPKYKHLINIFKEDKKTKTNKKTKKPTKKPAKEDKNDKQ